MKKIFKALLNAVVLSAVLLSLTACSGSSADAAASGKNGAAPYELTEDEQALLSALGITDMNSLILTFRAPAGTEELIVRLYTLGEERNWKEADSGKIFLDEQEMTKETEGLFTMQVRKDYSLEFCFKLDGSSMTYETGPPAGREPMAYTRTFLPEFQEMEPNTEVPVAILSYTTGNTAYSCRLQDYYDTSNLSQMDLIQAVTLEFASDEAE